MTLEVDAPAERFFAWREELLAGGAHMADVNDGMLVWGTARVIWNRHPALRPVVARVTPECVQRAAGELGMFMGCRHLCERVGLDPEVGEGYMLGLMGGRIPGLGGEAG